MPAEPRIEPTAAEYLVQLDRAREFLESHFDGRRPAFGLVLGSGLGAAEFLLERAVEIPAADIPHLPQPSVAGHGQAWTLGTIGGRDVLIAGGRVHRYEGVSLRRATFGVRLMAAVGARGFIVTNAAGGIRDGFQPGLLMRISDHINLLGDSPLVGDHDDRMGARFVDMTSVYDREWGELAADVSAKLGIELASGVYAACLGPQYETPAEIRYLRALGADAVGMSTVPEVIVARQCGLRIFGLSLISNAAAGITGEPLSHAEVIEAGRGARTRLTQLLSAIVAGATFD